MCVSGFAGTPGYLSPEVLRKDPYGKPVDMWACGKTTKARKPLAACLSLQEKYSHHCVCAPHQFVQLGEVAWSHFLQLALLKCHGLKQPNRGHLQGGTKGLTSKEAVYTHTLLEKSKKMISLKEWEPCFGGTSLHIAVISTHV